jgi:hypothetical protein
MRKIRVNECVNSIAHIINKSGRLPILVMLIFLVTGFKIANSQAIIQTFVDNSARYRISSEQVWMQTKETGSGSIFESTPLTIPEGPVLTTIVVTPSSASVIEGNNADFNATGYDENGNTMAITEKWTVSGGGSIDSSGVFSATNVGTYSIKAAVGFISGEAQVTVTPNGAVVPGKIQAENYTNMFGVQTETTTDAGGGLNVGWIATGDWMTYKVSVAKSGTYSVNFRAAGWTGTGIIALQDASFNTLASANVPNNGAGSYQVWKNVPGNHNFVLTAGSQIIRIYAAGPSWNLNWFEITSVEIPMLATIEVSPSTLSIIQGEKQQFAAVAKDQYGKVIATQPAFMWSATGGTVSSSGGLYTAGVTAGKYAVIASSGNVSEAAQVTILPARKLASIVITPGYKDVMKDAMFGFTATGYDQYGSIIDILPAPTWTVSGGGTINASGVFTGTTVGGPYTVFASSGTISANAQVKVTEGPVLTTIDVTPATAAISLGQTQQFTAIGKDQNGNAMSFIIPVEWTITPSSNIISSQGLVTPLLPGTYIVYAQSGIIKGSATLTVSDGIVIPGKFEAENYSGMFGIQKETCTDVGGGQNISYVDAGDWLDYNVNVTAAGTYKVTFRVASFMETGALQFKKGTTVLATVKVPNTKGWQNWQSISAIVTLVQGAQTLRISATGSGANINWIDFSSTMKIEAESYSAMFGIQTETTTDEGGGLDVGYTHTGDYLDYQVTIPAAGLYTIDFRVASLVSTGKIEFRNQAGTALATLTQGTTGGWQTWVTKSLTANFAAGAQTFRIYYLGSGLNINWFAITQGGLKSVDEPTAETNGFKVYPNPATDMITIERSSSDYNFVEIRSLTGAVLLAQPVTANETQLDISILDKGLYLIILQGSSRMLSKKLFVE